MANLGQFGLQIAVLVVMLVGLIGLLTTVIPGLVIIWAAALVYGLVDGFSWASGIIFAVLTVLMVAGSLVDNFLMGASARRTGASWLSIAVSLVLGVVGTIVLPPFGGLLGALLGVFAVEVIRLRDWQQAWRSTRSVATGCGLGVVAKMWVGLMMILLWALWAFGL